MGLLLFFILGLIAGIVVGFYGVIYISVFVDRDHGIIDSLDKSWHRVWPNQ